MNVVLQILFWGSIAFVAYSYILYPLLLRILAPLFGTDVKHGPQELPTLAVLVPAYNEEAVIGRKIANILASNYPAERISVWVGSDCSSDGTNAIVQNYGDPRVHLWIAPQRSGKSGIVNALAQKIAHHAEVIIFTDANTMHASDAFLHLVRPFCDARVGGAAGHIDHLSTSSPEIEERLYRSFESGQKRFESRLHSTISAYGGFYAVRSAIFEPIPANAYSNDDVLIPMGVIRKGYRMVFVPQARSSEDMTEDLSSEFRRRVRIGAGNFQAFFWLLDFLNPLRGWPAFCYFSHKVTRWFSPLFLLSALLAAFALSVMEGYLFYSLIVCAIACLVLLGVLAKAFRFRQGMVVYYFLVMNVALILGFFKFLRGIRSAAWDRTQRA
jgi:cellulose synthase/poly-beta-1,6-N-acetylglucosamine synthase-like glycosyltransferase